MKSNIFRMWRLSVYKAEGNIPIKVYAKALGELLVHMFTQKRTLGCDDSQLRWFEHLVLVFGYLTLLFTTVFLDWFSTGSQVIILLGYAESAVIFVITLLFMADRITRNKEVSKHSHPSDWLFVVWLFMMGLSAFVVRLFIDLQILDSNLWIYLIHLIILIQWALIIVPFGKWTHFLYRSFAMYFRKVKEA